MGYELNWHEFAFENIQVLCKSRDLFSFSDVSLRWYRLTILRYHCEL